MEKHIACLVKALDQLGLSHRYIDREQNLVQVTLPWGKEYFQLNKTPFNSEVVYHLCRDKMHTYEILNEHIRMPKTLSFLDSTVPAEYRHYCQYHSMEEMVEATAEHFDFPVVIKRNAGALGKGVYLCEDKEQVRQALDKTFDHHSKEYDFLALAQQYVSSKLEYRLLCAFGEPILAYQRGSKEGFNLRYWEQDEIAIQVHDESLIQELYEFVRPCYEHIDLGWVGFDIILGHDGNYHLIELNSSPKFNNFINNNESQQVVDLYVRAMKLFMARRGVS